MKRQKESGFKAFVIFFVLVLACGSSAGTLKKAELKVPGIECATAGMKAVYAAQSVDGVTDAIDDMSNNTLTVIFDDGKADIDAIRKALREAGYPAEGEPRYLE
jgi:copper chaperone CopZ